MHLILDFVYCSSQFLPSSTEPSSPSHLSHFLLSFHNPDKMLIIENMYQVQTKPKATKHKAAKANHKSIVHRMNIRGDPEEHKA